MSRSLPAQLDSDELLELHEYHRLASRRQKLTDASRAYHSERARYFFSLVQESLVRVSACRVPRNFHSYTHNADGDLIRLDSPVG